MVGMDRVGSRAAVTHFDEAARQRDFETVVSRFRWILTAFVTVYVTLVNGFSLRRGWLCVAVLVLSGGIVTLALRRPLTLERLQLLGAFVLATDVALVLVAVFGDMAPAERGIYLAGALVVFEGGARWRRAGGVGVAAVLSVGLAAWMGARASRLNLPFDWAALAFRSTMLLFFGLAVDKLVRQRERAREQQSSRLMETEVLTSFAVEAPRAPKGEAVQLLAAKLHGDLGFERVVIMAHDPEPDVLRAYAVAGYAPEIEENAKRPGAALQLATGGGVVARCFRTGNSQIVGDVRADPDYLHVDPDVRSELCVLLRAGGRRLGVLMVSATQVDAFNAPDARLLETLAGELAQILENARLADVQREAIDELRRLAEMKDDFIAIASHELRTPLTALRGFARALDERGDDLTPDQRKRAVAAVARQTERLSTLVEELLAASLIDSGRSTPSVEDVDLVRVAEEAVVEAAAGVAGGRRSHDVKIEIPATLPPLAADPSFVRRVLVNLVSNALRYSPEGGPIVVQARPQTAGDGRALAVVEVTDEGVGIEPDDLPRLFHKFVRFPSDDRAGGTGLGLFIVKGLVESMGGEVSVDSTPGLGSRFGFTVPLAPGTPVAHAGPAGVPTDAGPADAGPADPGAGEVAKARRAG